MRNLRCLRLLFLAICVCGVLAPAGSIADAVRPAPPLPAGPAGPAGPTGPPGSALLTPLPRPAGHPRLHGAADATGPAGATGPADGTGARRASRTAVLSEFAYIYNQSEQIVPSAGNVSFDTNGVASAGITHAPTTDVITVVTPGIYNITFSVSGVEPGQMGLYLNNAGATGAVYGWSPSIGQATGHAILTLAPGDVLTVRNYSATPVVLKALAGGTHASTNASVAVEKLS